MRRLAIAKWDIFCLRVAAVVTLIFAAGHTLGFSQPTGEAAEMQARLAMQKLDFALPGATVNYWGLFVGFGLIIGVYLGFQACLLWVVVGLKKQSVQISGVVWLLLLANVFNTVLLFRYLFIVPQLLSALICALIAAGTLLGRRSG